MVETQVYLREEELVELREAAARSGPVGLWDGEPRRISLDHNSIYDQP